MCKCLKKIFFKAIASQKRNKWHEVSREKVLLPSIFCHCHKNIHIKSFLSHSFFHLKDCNLMHATKKICISHFLSSSFPSGWYFVNVYFLCEHITPLRKPSNDNAFLFSISKLYCSWQWCRNILYVFKYVANKNGKYSYCHSKRMIYCNLIAVVCENLRLYIHPPSLFYC